MTVNTSASTFLCVMLLGCGAAAGLQVRDPGKGAALLAEARQAVGGQDRLRAVKALDVRGDLRRSIGQTTINGEVQIRIELPDKLRRDEDLSPPGSGPAIVRTEVLNGTAVWEETSGGLFLGRFGRGDAGRAATGRGGRAPIDLARVEEAQRRARQADLARFLLVWLLSTDRPAAWVGTAEAPDGRADVLEVTPAVGPVMRLFLDQTSHLPLLLTWQGAAPQFVIAGRRGRGENPPTAPPLRGGQQATFRMTLEDYKAVDGLKLPHRITRGVNDTTIEEWTVESYRINPSFRADVFSR